MTFWILCGIGLLIGFLGQQFLSKYKYAFVLGLLIGTGWVSFVVWLALPNQQKTIARLEAEVDSLKTERAENPPDSVYFRMRRRVDDYLKEIKALNEKWATERLLFLEESREKNMAWEQVGILRVRLRECCDTEKQ